MKVAGMFHAERRSSPRVTTELRIMFPWADQFIEGRTIDLSETGMRVSSNRELGVGTRFVLYFEAPGSRAQHTIEVEVAWSQKTQVDSAPFQAGCRFIKLGAGAAETLAEILRNHPAQAPEAVEEEDIVEFPEQGGWRPGETLDDALAEDTKRREQDRQIADRLLQIAQDLQKQGELETAASVLQNGLQRVADSPQLLEALAQIMMKLGQVSEAATLLDKALRIRQEQKK